MWRTKKYKLILVFDQNKHVKYLTESDIIKGEFYNLTEDLKE